jgi:hypothetical protein
MVSVQISGSFGVWKKKAYADENVNTAESVLPPAVITSTTISCFLYFFEPAHLYDMAYHIPVGYYHSITTRPESIYSRTRTGSPQIQPQPRAKASAAKRRDDQTKQPGAEKDSRSAKPNSKEKARGKKKEKAHRKGKERAPSTRDPRTPAAGVRRRRG